VPISKEVVWYSVFLETDGFLRVNPFASPSTLDTEIGLYRSDGTLLNSNDDAGGSFLSNVSMGVGAGLYFIAVGFYDTVFGLEDFEVTPSPFCGQCEGIRLTVSYTTDVVTLFGTGKGLDIGDSDPHYQWKLSAEPTTIPGPAVVAWEPWWSLNDEESSWIGFSTNAAPGDYGVSTTFDLTRYEITTVVLTLAVQVDYILQDIRLNDVSLGFTAADPNNFALFTVNSGFLPGINRLEFLWMNNIGSTGIRINAHAEAQLR
jgi:hypothetical protein